jgi:hypothetical protein
VKQCPTEFAFQIIEDIDYTITVRDLDEKVKEEYQDRLRK